MKVYIAITKDRHFDIQAVPFFSESKAVDYARKTAKELCKFLGDYKETVIKGWIFYAQYSCESDSIHVVEKEVRE